MYKVSHKKPDGTFVNEEARELHEKLQSELQNCSENEAFLRVCGKEHPGYVRGMGLGVSPSQIIGSSSHATSSTTSFESNERIEQMQAEIDSLKAQVAEVDVLKQQIAFLMQRAKRDETPDLESPVNRRSGTSYARTGREFTCYYLDLFVFYINIGNLKQYPSVGSVSARHRATAVTTISNKVLVAVKAEKVICNTALAWALTHVVHSSDSITLLAVYSPPKTGRRFWTFSRFARNCKNGPVGKLPEQISDISESCAQMVLQLHNQIEVRVKIKVVTGTPSGAVAAEARRSGSHWVILDKKLKQEVKHCMDELNCSIVVMNGSQAKIHRLNLGCSDELQTPFFSATSSPGIEIGKLKGRKLKHSTPVSSPEEAGTSITRNIGVNSGSSSDSTTSLFLVYEQNPLYEGQGPEKKIQKSINEPKEFNVQPPLYFDLERDYSPPSWTRPTSSMASDNNTKFWIPQNHVEDEKFQKTKNNSVIQRTKSPTSKTLLENFIHSDQETRKNDLEFNRAQSRSYIPYSGIKDKSIPLGRTTSIPPPLCSQCQNKAPVFGKPPKRFSYKELQEATNMFSDVNFLAKGGFGVVHKGILKDGQVVAVKQLKFGGSQADLDFCREVQIAIGAARGLRYLHEDCRVGCIVHRDFRPKNILLTHDFEPLFNGYSYLSEWFHPLRMLEPSHILQNVRSLKPCFVSEESLEFNLQMQAMARAASLCLRVNPDARPPMSKVLRVLEGGDPVRPMGLDINSVGNTSGHLSGLNSHTPLLKVQ
ncbi:hypothetical protein Fmac_032522 [Flemingia macrophylla]|uniref:Protein kinase domain-containing protein n=1 Tax=Flemingia macrophylla TaxID=520843 RepID=A0ABD1L586_9FABA